MTSYAQHVVTGLSCHLSCLRRLAPEPSARVRLSMKLAVKTFPGSGQRRLAAGHATETTVRALGVPRPRERNARGPTSSCLGPRPAQ
jgi:hypothetical protein